ncbi:MAG: ABC transporter ATP-binding protein [Desulfobacterales bacterium]|nr:ABC transporter ATP-binding protein [Desulfobacterales bacterium]
MYDNDKILEVKNLSVAFNTDLGIFKAVDNVSFEVKKGKILGIVGESGCGKTVTALSIMRLLPKPSAFIENGEIFFKEVDIVKLNPNKLHEIRGKKISMIFQEPMTSLNPVHTIGKQISEVYKIHGYTGKANNIFEDSIKMLEKVGIPDPLKRIREYPHQISGGMRQRVMIAIALACNPSVLIADEPTTALDVTIQAQILQLMKALQTENKMSIILITHDLGVVAEMCDHVAVMYGGKIIEIGNVYDIFHNPQHPYTIGLLESIPRLESKRKTRLPTIKGMVPSLYEMPDGCRFQNRCNKVKDICVSEPKMIEINNEHFAACHMLKSEQE